MTSHGDEEPPDNGLEPQSDQGRIDLEESRQAAVSAAMFAIGWPGGFAILLLTLQGMATATSPGLLVMGMFYGLLLGNIFMLLAGHGIGRFAHYWFRDTDTSPKRMATVIALIFDAVIFGWFLVMVLRPTAMR